MHVTGAPPIDEEEDGDRQIDADDLRDYLEQDIVPPQRPPAIGPYASFLASMPDWINMTQDENNKSWEALPLPAVGPVPPGISLERAIKVQHAHVSVILSGPISYPKWKHIRPDIQDPISYPTWYPI